MIKPWRLIIKLDMTNYNTILIEKKPKYQLYHQAKLVSMNVLEERKCYHLIKKNNRTKLNLLILLWEKRFKNK